MRTILVSGGIRTFITLHEGAWLDAHSEDQVYKNQLSDRDQVIAQSLVSKGVLNKHMKDQQVFYTRNTNRMTT